MTQPKGKLILNAVGVLLVLGAISAMQRCGLPLVEAEAGPIAQRPALMADEIGQRYRAEAEPLIEFLEDAGGSYEGPGILLVAEGGCGEPILVVETLRLKPLYLALFNYSGRGLDVRGELFLDYDPRSQLLEIVADGEGGREVMLLRFNATFESDCGLRSDCCCSCTGQGCSAERSYEAGNACAVGWRAVCLCTGPLCQSYCMLKSGGGAEPVLP